MIASFVQREDQVIFSMMMSYKRPDDRQKKADTNGINCQKGQQIYLKGFVLNKLAVFI